MFFTAASRTEEAMMKAISKYEKASRFMKGDMNSQKLDMANMVIKYVVQSLSNPFYRFFLSPLHSSLTSITFRFTYFLYDQTTERKLQ